MRYVSGGVAILFGLMAAVQFNDPDPYVWVLAYGAAAVGSALYAAGAFPRRPAAILCGGYVLGILILLPQVWASSLFQAEEMMGLAEVAREIGGLALAAGWMGVLVVWGGPTSDRAGSGE
jgi:hypothetical protein